MFIITILAQGCVFLFPIITDHWTATLLTLNKGNKLNRLVTLLNTIDLICNAICTFGNNCFLDSSVPTKRPHHLNMSVLNNIMFIMARAIRGGNSRQITHYQDLFSPWTLLCLNKNKHTIHRLSTLIRWYFTLPNKSLTIE